MPVRHVALLFLLGGCADPSPSPSATVVAPIRAAIPDAEADRTALLSLTLSREGTAELIDARVREIPFRAKNVGSKSPYTLEARFEAQEPFVVALELGEPGESSGDVIDHWTSGGTIVRAPFFGSPTRYSLVRTARDGRRDVLATREVTR